MPFSVTAITTATFATPPLVMKFLEPLSTHFPLRNSAVVLVPAASDPALASNVEYFSERVLLAASEKRLFTIVDRANLQKILEELELQLSGLVDDASAAKVGGLLGAEALVTGTLVEREGRLEVFFKLVRVGTAEVLAVTRARLDADLGL